MKFWIESYQHRPTLHRTCHIPCDNVASLSVSSYNVNTVFFCAVSSTYPIESAHSPFQPHPDPTSASYSLTHSYNKPVHSSTFLHHIHASLPVSTFPLFPLPIHSARPSFRINSITSLASSRLNRFPSFLFQNKSVSSASTNDNFHILWYRQ